MSTKDSIIQLADNLIRDKGFNAFSFHDISKAIGIKTASIHYHFPTKSDLGVAIIKDYVKRIEFLKTELKDKSPWLKLEGFFSIYAKIKSENKVCLVGSLATDLNTVDKKIKKELKILAEMVLHWVTDIVQEGKDQKVFKIKIPSRTKAIMIVSSMLAIVQLSRLTKDDDFITVKETIIKELKGGK